MSDWDKLRAPFNPDEIELLPKYTGKKGPDGKPPRGSYRKCDECGRVHPFPCVHLRYVGHAGITDRLNDCDPEWNWQPAALDEKGLPLITRDGMWIKLTVLGVTRWGFGDAQGKTGPNAVKETIGDAIRNAAMRFGVGTYLWSKSEKAEHIAEYGCEEPEKQDDAPEEAACEPERPAGPEELSAAKRTLWDACKAYAQRHGLEPKSVSDGCLKRPDFDGTPEWYVSVAAELEES